jgi:HPt (histidine-containing phosphotransfer) domain-containing protein
MRFLVVQDMPSAPQDADPVDRQALAEIMEDRDLVDTIVQAFVAVFPAALGRVRIAADAGDLTELRHAAHSLAGSAHMTAVASIAQAAAAVEQACLDGGAAQALDAATRRLWSAADVFARHYEMAIPLPARPAARRP